jgi:GntR family transcriptional regulator/MocR family aminotransferase
VPDAALGYGDRTGAPVLRAALAGYLGRSRGVAAAPDRLVVASGTMQGLGLVARALAGRGVRRVAVEHPGFPLHRVILARAGLEVVEVEVDGGGLRVEDLAAADAGAVLVTPAHQMPTGAVLAPERRAALLEWAAATGALVLEDDYNGEYRYDREPVGALQGLAPERVAYLGSASKTLAPGLRLAWIVAPEAIAETVREEKQWADGGSPAIAQHALADLISSGELDRHVRRMRASYRRRRDQLVAAVHEHLPGARVGGVAAGLHALVTLPPGLGVEAVLQAAWGDGVGVYGYEHAGATHLLLGFASLPEPSVEPAVRALARALA